MNESKIKARLLKLLALAKRGEGGERENAQRFLERELQRRGMTVEDLDDDKSKPVECEFRWRHEYERWLLIQILAMVTESDRVRYTKAAREKRLFTKLTTAQKMEVEMFYEAYRVSLSAAIELTIAAFVMKNDIFSRNQSTENIASPEMSMEDMVAIAAIMAGMRRTEVRRAIENC